MVKSGIVYSYGMGFWGPNGHDGVWHISIVESLAKGSLGMPIFAGAKLMNYHYGFDLLAAFVHKLTFIPVVNLYFQVIPPILALAVGVSCYRFVKGWSKSSLAALWATFFVYFGGSFGWFVNLLRGYGFLGESMFWSQQSISTLINPPFALSLVIVFAGLDVLRRSMKTGNKRMLGLATILFGLLIIVKVYAGLLIIGGLLVAGIFQIMRVRDFGLFKVFGGVLILSLLLLLPTIDVSRSLIEYKPFWFLETMMAFSDRVGWDRFYSAMTTYRQGGLLFKGLVAYSFAFMIFILGNFSTRVIGFIYFIKAVRKPSKIDYVDVILFSIIASGVLVPMLFVQKGTPWNTIQFLYYSLVFTGILAGVVVGGWIENTRGNIGKILISTLIIIITLPTALATLSYDYLPGRPPAKLSHAELEALEYLRSQPQGVVLTYPFDKQAAEVARANPPRPLYLYESSAYVSAFSGKDVYMEDEVNLNITGYDWPGRRADVEIFLSTLDERSARDFLSENDIAYVYLVGKQRATLGDTQLGLEKIFGNDEVIIYVER